MAWRRSTTMSSKVCHVNVSDCIRSSLLPARPWRMRSAFACRLAMTTMDVVNLFGGEPANFLDIGGSSNPEKVVTAFDIILKDPEVRSIFINIFGGITRCDDVANGIVAAFEEFKPSVPVVIRLTGTNANGIILGFMIATAFLSMWISNTATTVMMLPIALSVVDLLTRKGERQPMSPGQRAFAVSLMLGIAYAANIGGTATLIRDPPNIIIGSKVGLTFNQFVMNLTLPVLICFVCGLLFIWLTNREKFKPINTNLAIAAERRATGARQRAAHSVGQQRPVGQAGQGVVIGQVLDLGVGALALAEVTCDAQ